MALTKQQKQARKAAREAVARGAALLDKRMPTWFRKIDLSDLDLSDCSACVCGQLATHSRARMVVRAVKLRGEEGYQPFSAYLRGVSHGYDSFEFNADHGFTTSPVRPYDFDDLDREWQRVIRRKLREAEAA